ncbi:efflux RND transporter periplasmic adaptor subunit [Natronospira bacteriovora]|uniref:Efflux RND transporter periplasmic adaptor subunit n=1 Tax=Natronospira bacteriovora TaxID=3069753 RepID=A0ABU0W7S7_9GAMM|nr:efflux RND transporter periplasmic adaptor subunit [Natronospira sp. AB-CW4]MDQ2069974.1 efflux RND transporter periplasmic adaptor subunit [Natronospira sp. AB-CW4]
MNMADRKMVWLPRLLVAVALTLSLAACQQEADTPENQQAEESRASVRAETPRLERVSANHRTTATLRAISDARVVSRADGLVRELRVEEGDRVQAGQILAVLDDERRALEVRQRRADLGGLEQDYARQKQLQAENLVSADAVEKLRFQIEAQRAALSLAEVELAETRIKAPVDGVVSERHIRLGDNVSPGDVVFRVTDTSRLEAEVHVPERLMGRLAVDQLVEIRSDASPDRVHGGRISRISPVVDADSGTVRATVSVDDGNGLLRPGTFARLRILYDTRDNALLVPRQALSFENGRTTLFVIRDGVAERREVQTGYSEEGWVEILDGLMVDEPVITLGHATLRDGAKVRINGREDSMAVAENKSI